MEGVSDKIRQNRSESVVSFAGDLNDANKKHAQYVSDNIALLWQNLTYYGNNTANPILWQLNGQLNFGTLTALMGPSGAGKTTLLRCINGVDKRRLSDNTKIFLNKNKQIYPCFVVQDIKEHLLMSLTVRESLMYASLLKNSEQSRIAKLMNHSSKGTSRRDSIIQANLFVEKLVIDLMLNDCIDTKISRCSGGEQKRVVIAMELTAQIKPNLICIDEPTSGLDSNSAEQTVFCLQNIARKHNLAIVTSIHQPNSDVLMMFDKLYVLSKGHCVYFGAPIDLRQHLSECQIQCLEYQTPIEVLLKVSSNFTKNTTNNKSTENEKTNLGLSDEVSRLISKTNENMRTNKTSDTTNRRQSFGTLDDIDRVFNFRDMRYLLKRSILYSWIRQWKLNAFMFVLFVSYSIIMSILFSSDIGLDANCIDFDNITEDNCVNKYKILHRQESLMEQNLKFLYFICAFISFIYLTISILIFPPEIKIFLNEHRNRWYSTGSYYWAKTVTEIPLLLIIIYFYCWIGYYGTSQPDMSHWYNGVIYSSERFPLFLMVFVLTLLNVQGLAMFASILFSRNQHMIQIVSIGIYLIMIFFGGFFIPLNNLSPILQILSHMSFMKTQYHLVLIIIFGRNRCVCDSDPMALILFDVNEDDFWFYIFCLFADLLFWRILPLFLLLIQANPNQSNTKSKSNNNNNNSDTTITNSNKRVMPIWANDPFCDRF